MDNQKRSSNLYQLQPYPWYDDRVETVRKEYVNPWAEEAVNGKIKDTNFGQ